MGCVAVAGQDARCYVNLTGRLPHQRRTSSDSAGCASSVIDRCAMWVYNVYTSEIMRNGYDRHDPGKPGGTREMA